MFLFGVDWKKSSIRIFSFFFVILRNQHCFGVFDWRCEAMSANYVWRCITTKETTWLILKVRGIRPTWLSELLVRLRKLLLSLSLTSVQSLFAEQVTPCFSWGCDWSTSYFFVLFGGLCSCRSVCLCYGYCYWVDRFCLVSAGWWFLRCLVISFKWLTLDLVYVLAVKIGRPGYRVTKQYDPELKQRSLLFQVSIYIVIVELHELSFEGGHVMVF